MKVLHVIRSMEPSLGGTVEAVRRLSEALAQAGHEVRVASADDPSAGYLADYPFPVQGLGPGRGGYGYAPRLTSWLAAHGGGFDGVIAHGVFDHAAFATRQALRGTATPYGVFTHGMLDPWFRRTYPLKHVKKQLYWWAAGGRVLRDAGAVLFTNEEERRLARGAFLGPSYRERVVALGTAGAPDAAAAQRAAFDALMPRLAGRRFLLFLGRLHQKKGCDLLIEAFADLAAGHPDTDLVMAGPDPAGLGARLRDRAGARGIGARVHWPGLVSGPAKWGAMRAAEVLVLPSHQENFGFVLAEAMSCGTPVLTTRRVNVWREIEASGGGLVGDDTAAGMGDLLGRWLGLPAAARQAMGVAARAGFEAHFRLEASARDLVDVIDQMKRAAAAPARGGPA